MGKKGVNKPLPYKTHHFVAGDPTMVRPPANKRKPPPGGAHHGRGPALIGALTPARVLFVPYVAEFSEKVLTTPHSCAILMVRSGERMKSSFPNALPRVHAAAE